MRTAPATRRAFDRARFADIADWLAIAVAVSLPWSTSATSILIALWLVALIPALNVGELGRSTRHPAAALPLVLGGLALIGVLWSVAPLRESLSSLESFAKLLMIPLLIFQFSRSGKGMKVAYAFLISCAALLVLSWLLTFFPAIPWRYARGGTRGIPVKEYIIQSGEFLLCVFALAHLALDAWQKRQWRRAAVLAAGALIFFANIVFVATSRTSVIVFFFLALAFGFQRFRWKGAIAGALAACALGVLAAALSPYLRERVLNVIEEVDDYSQRDAETSTGYRLEFWKKSAHIIAQAPIVGHGTGSIEEMFRRDAVGKSGMSAAVTANPHNQTLSIGIQFGLLGVSVLFAMWIAHALLFCRPGLAASIGLAVVVQNVVSSLSNSQLFYFAPGWLYVFGVGALGGVVLRELQRSGPSPGIDTASGTSTDPSQRLAGSAFTHPPSAPQ